MIRMSRREFEDIVDQALQELPKEFAEKIVNVEIIIEDYPSLELQQRLKINPQGLLGLYSGVPNTQRGITYPPLFPDHIYLYQKNLESYARNREELIEQIQRTVLHEIGHYFGIDDRRLRELGF